MAGYPRNNLHEQLAAKGKSGTVANGPTNLGKTARQQAGLAREMSGLGQYVGLGFSFRIAGLWASILLSLHADRNLSSRRQNPRSAMHAKAQQRSHRATKNNPSHFSLRHRPQISLLSAGTVRVAYPLKPALLLHPSRRQMHYRRKAKSGQDGMKTPQSMAWTSTNIMMIAASQKDLTVASASKAM